MESSATLWVSGEATAFLLPITASRELHLCSTEIAFVFFRGGVSVADSPVVVAVAAASVERITAVADAAVVSLYAAPRERAAVADAAAIALAAAAPVVGAAVAVADALTIVAAAPAEGAAVAKAAVEGPDPEALFLSLSQASLLSLLYCCLLALGRCFFIFMYRRPTLYPLEIAVDFLKWDIMYKLRPNTSLQIPKIELHCPGIEPGPPVLQAGTLPKELFTL